MNAGVISVDISFRRQANMSSGPVALWAFIVFSNLFTAFSVMLMLGMVGCGLWLLCGMLEQSLFLLITSENCFFFNMFACDLLSLYSIPFLFCIGATPVFLFTMTCNKAPKSFVVFVVFW